MAKIPFDPDALKSTNSVEEEDVYLETEDIEEEDIDEEDAEDTDTSEDEDEEEEEEKEDEEDEEDEESSRDEEDEEESTDDELDTKTVEKLLKRINELSSAAPQQSGTGAYEDINFDVLTDDDVVALNGAETKEEYNKIFNKLLNAAVKKSIEFAESAAAYKIERKLSANKIAEQFYYQNPDLEPVSNYVLNIAQTISKDEENKDLSLAQLLDKAGTLARKALGLKKPKKGDRKDGKPRKKKMPAPKGSRAGGRRVPKKAKTLQDEIDELVTTFKPRSLK